MDKMNIDIPPPPDQGSESKKSEKKQKMILFINSGKGGVGKTTLALAVAMEALDNRNSVSSQEKRTIKHSSHFPVIYIDADIFGTEVTDLIMPYDGKDSRKWDIALIDLLIHSTGGIHSFREYLRIRLKGVTPSSSNFPTKKMKETHQKPLLIIPSYAERNVGKRNPWNPDYLGFTLLTESFGRLQLEMRMTVLIDVLLEVLSPGLIIIDNSPFHIPLSNVWEKWIDIDKKKDEQEREDQELLFYGSNKHRWKEYLVRILEVAGPDEQDLRAFLSEVVDQDRRENCRKKGKRWILNRDVYVYEPRTGAYVCNTHDLLPLHTYEGPELGHVMFNQELARGIHSRNLIFGPTGKGFKKRVKPLSFLELLEEANPRVSIFDLKKDNFKVQSWMEFLK